MECIDCLFIGTNRIDVKAFRNAALEFVGDKHPSFRFFDQDFLKYKGELWLVENFYNYLISTDEIAERNITPINLNDDFNTAIAYLGTYLNRRGFTFDYINSFQEGKDALAEKLKNNRYRIIALTTTLSITPEPVAEVIQFVRENCSDAKIVAGGVFIAQLFSRYDRNILPMVLDNLGADYYINSYQGEFTLVNFLSALKKGQSIVSVPNLYYKKGDIYVENKILPECNKISDNAVDWSLFANDLKNHAWIRTSVSCNFNCAFCTYPVHGGKYQTTDIENIEYELNLLKQAGVNWLFFTDDTFNIPKERFKKVVQMIHKNNYGFNWGCFYRCQFADEETLQLMKECGCKLVFLGLESGNNQVLKNMNKGVTVDKYRMGIDLIKKAGIHTFGSFIIGFPGETEQSVRQTIELIKETDFYQPNVWIYSGEAPISKRKEEFGLKVENEFEWSHNTMDSITATDILQHVITTVTESARLPMFETNALMIPELNNRGMTVDQAQQFMSLFNQGINTRLKGRADECATEGIVDSMRSLIRSTVTPN